MDKSRYAYEGPVTIFGTIVDRKWYGETVAVSEKKAKSNLSFQFKQENGLTAGSKVDLPGKLYLVEE